MKVGSLGTNISPLNLRRPVTRKCFVPYNQLLEIKTVRQRKIITFMCGGVWEVDIGINMIERKTISQPLIQLFSRLSSEVN